LHAAVSLKQRLFFPETGNRAARWLFFRESFHEPRGLRGSRGKNRAYHGINHAVQSNSFPKQVTSRSFPQASAFFFFFFGKF
jgi:hypothetical protein